jgi:hypothetical protein
MSFLTPAHWLGLLAVIVVPLLFRHVQSKAEEAECEHVSAGWMKSHR